MLEHHTATVSRWAAEAARERQADPGFEEKMLWLDEELSNRGLEALERGTYELRTTKNVISKHHIVDFDSPGTDIAHSAPEGSAVVGRECVPST